MVVVVVVVVVIFLTRRKRSFRQESKTKSDSQDDLVVSSFRSGFAEISMFVSGCPSSSVGRYLWRHRARNETRVDMSLFSDTLH